MARKRVVLNHKAVFEIQSLAPTFANVMRRGVKSQMSNEVALKFGVDAKTIRDIWNRKSWKGFIHSDNNNQNENIEQQRITDSFLFAEHATAAGEHPPPPPPCNDNDEGALQWVSSMSDLLED
jgi:hypothetical protein